MRFASFAWGGFEAASHRRADGERVDSVAASLHDVQARLDHALLRSMGVRTAREALRWHLVEQREGIFDWTSARGQIEGARAAGTEVIWDICHWGVPDGVDVMSPAFPGRLARFAARAARHLKAEGVRIGGWVPVNEIAFWAWAGGATGGFAPFLWDEGAALKARLLEAHLAVVAALRAEGALEPILLSEPLIHVVPRLGYPETAPEAEAVMTGAFEAVEWLLARDARCIDVLGLNHYPTNQWDTCGERLAADDPRRLPLRALLRDVEARFGLPLALTETGAEEPWGDAWLAGVAEECAVALAEGTRLLGVCIYPVMDYPGWDNGRACPCGPIGQRAGRRFVRPGQRAMLARLAALGSATMRQQQTA